MIKYYLWYHLQNQIVMREYARKPERQSRTLDSNPKASRQAPIDVIFQRYKERNIQRYAEDEELIQGKLDSTQREKIDEDGLLLGKFEYNPITEQKPIQRKERPNNTGLPDNLKTGIENLSGYSMNDVKVHYNSDKPAQLQALAYAQGTDIHIAPGQEQYLPHEAWHVVQQKQGRVQPTMQIQGVNLNDNEAFEKEADERGFTSLGLSPQKNIEISHKFDTLQTKSKKAIQRTLKIGGIPKMNPDDIQELFKPRVQQMILSCNEYEFHDILELENHIALLLESTEFAKCLHQNLYKIIYQRVINSGGSIAASSVSTTGVLYVDGRTFEVACNFAETPKGEKKARGVLVSVSDVIAALNMFSGGSPLKLGPETIRVHNSAPEIKLQEYGETPRLSETLGLTTPIDDLALAVVGQDWAQILAQKIGDSWPSFVAHADMILVARAKVLGLSHPIIGISKAPCELCGGEGLTGRSIKGEETGISSNISLSVPMSKFQALKALKGQQKMGKEVSIKNDLQKIIEKLFNDKIGVYGGKITVENRSSDQAFTIKIPRWIPPELIDYHTVKADVITEIVYDFE